MPGFGLGMYNTRRYRRPYRRYPNRRYKKRVTTKLVANIARKVHYSQVERKWRGFALTSTKQPNTGDITSQFDSHTPLVLDRGTNSSQREGREVHSQGLELNLYISNTYEFPFHMRILCLRAKQNTVVPLPANILIDPITKAPQLMTGFASDCMRKVSNELWTVLYDRTHYLWPQGRDTASAVEGIEVGRSRFSQIFKCRAKHNLRLNYELALTNITDEPVRNTAYWVILFTFGETNTPPPAFVDPDQVIRFTRQSYHYFKDA